jgi:hypothetical protein
MKDQLGYATMADSNVYHLVDLKTSRTLCGLLTKHTSNAVTLLVSTKQPEHTKLCRHCDDILDELNG